MCLIEGNRVHIPGKEHEACPWIKLQVTTVSTVLPASTLCLYKASFCSPVFKKCCLLELSFCLSPISCEVTSSCGWFIMSKGQIQKYNVDRKSVGPMQVAGFQTKCWPHTQRILLRLLRSVSSAAPETITFSLRDFFWSLQPPLPVQTKAQGEGGGGVG